MNPLPKTMVYSTAVQRGNTFLLVGGVSAFYQLTANVDVSDRVYEYDAENEDWTLLPVKLDTERRRAGAVIVERGWITT